MMEPTKKQQEAVLDAAEDLHRRLAAEIETWRAEQHLVAAGKPSAQFAALQGLMLATLIEWHREPLPPDPRVVRETLLEMTASAKAQAARRP